MQIVFKFFKFPFPPFSFPPFFASFLISINYIFVSKLYCFKSSKSFLVSLRQKMSKNFAIEGSRDFTNKTCYKSAINWRQKFVFIFVHLQCKKGLRRVKNQILIFFFVYNNFQCNSSLIKNRQNATGDGVKALGQNMVLWFKKKLMFKSFIAEKQII